MVILPFQVLPRQQFLTHLGLHRLSNFLLWQSAESEFYFSDKFWPDFARAEFDRALEAYRSRGRFT